MECQRCRYDDGGTCLMQVNPNVFYVEGSQSFDCPYYKEAKLQDRGRSERQVY
jgi:hypothetical protein